jgi:hypothetical protein
MKDETINVETNEFPFILVAACTLIGYRSRCREREFSLFQKAKSHIPVRWAPSFQKRIYALELFKE